MRVTNGWLATVAFLILAPAVAEAQFEALRFVDLPELGSWAQYEVTSGGRAEKKVTTQKVAFLSQQLIGEDEYYWFQLETESDDYGPTRVPMVMQFALGRQEAIDRKDYFRHLRELIVQVGDAPAVRIAPDFLQVGIQKNLLPGGVRGAGSEVDFTFRDLERTEIQSRAGSFKCDGKKGLGKAEIVVDLNDPERFEVDVIRELWYSDLIPFGLVKQVSQQTGQGPKKGAVDVSLDSEQKIDLVAFGVGATSAIRGQIFEYDPKVATKFRPASEEEPVKP